MEENQTITSIQGPVVLTLGMFDGVHLGHRALLARARTLAARWQCTPVAYSFIEHPQQVFGKAIECLTLPDERAEIIESLGVTPYFVPFDKERARLSPQDFVAALCQRFDVRGVVVGYNYHFGSRASGNTADMRALGKQHGFAVEVVHPVAWQGEAVSSSRIRLALREGRLPHANVMLTQPYFFRGVIQRGRQIGTQMGFPTLNLLPEGKAIPQHGVYAGWVHPGHALSNQEEAWPAVVSVGKNPTVTNDQRVIVESHILLPTGTLYGQEIVVRLQRFQRGVARFGSLDALQEQIARDCADAAIYLGAQSPGWRQGRL